jgi:hypothetical protein
VAAPLPIGKAEPSPEKNAAKLDPIWFAQAGGSPDSAKPVNPFSFLAGLAGAANGGKATG